MFRSITQVLLADSQSANFTNRQRPLAVFLAERKRNFTLLGFLFKSLANNQWNKKEKSKMVLHYVPLLLGSIWFLLECTRLLRVIVTHEFKKWRTRRRSPRILKLGEKLRGKASGSGSSKWSLGCEQGWRCGECYGWGISRLPMDVDIDHIVPVSQGGWDDEANLQILCPSCHAFKTRHSDKHVDKRQL